jgi:uncharacterized protein YjiS (DUF1127 family)
MHKAIGLSSAAARDGAAAAGVITQGTTPVTFLWRESAGNDPAGLLWAGSSATSHELIRAASARRALAIAEMVAASIAAVGSIARKAYARYRQLRQARATYDVLRHLDDWTLRDIGFDRSELKSVAAEMTGMAEHTRQRLLSHLER